MNKSFTLIEILVVIVVIGILSAFILVGMNSITTSANIAKSKAFSESLRSSLLDNLVSEWKLDEESGTNIIDSWKTNNGTLVNFANTSSGYGDNNTSGWMSEGNCISGTCLKLDGANNYISTTDLDFTSTNALSVSVWVKTSVSVTTIISKPDLASGAGSPKYVLDNAASNLRFFGYCVEGLRGITGGTIGGTRDGKWHHIVGTFDGTNWTIYKDVVTKQTLLSAGTLGNSNYNMLIGARNIDSSFWNGQIDNLYLYSTAIISFQIKENYFLGLNSLYKNGELDKIEYGQKLTQLKYNLVNNE
ncbi:MAG TPA: LamG domain-containing protein [Candidatus Pacearchaeota archaeon]|nr:LamG domain-containing protein [Candidatus Pacearchaeota archaeon]